MKTYGLQHLPCESSVVNKFKASKLNCGKGNNLLCKRKGIKSIVAEAKTFKCIFDRSVIRLDFFVGHS